MLFKNINLEELEEGYPMDISEIMEDANVFETKCYIDAKDIDKSKESLLDAKGILETIFSNLMSNLYDSKILKTEEEKIKYQLLSENISRCLGLLDRKEKALMGQEESNIGISNLSSFKTELSKIYFAMIINPLVKAKKKFIEEIKNNKGVKDKKRAFFYLLYQIMTVVCSSLYGSQRLIASGIGVSSMGKVSQPTSWQRLYAQSILKEKESGGKENEEERIIKDLQEFGEEGFDESDEGS